MGTHRFLRVFLVAVRPHKTGYIFFCIGDNLYRLSKEVKMKITFPHMGRLYIPLKTLFEELNIEVIVPPFNNDSIKNIGCKFSPEYACMPFKLILGNILHSLEQGADTVVMLGGSGPCRFGYFGHLLNMIARDLGYRFAFICLEPSSLPRDLMNLKKLTGCSYSAIASSI